MKTLTREQQHAQCMREVRATLIVVAICAAWHIGTAFALNGSGLYLLGMPAWFTVSVMGTAILGIAGVLLLAKFVFVDFAYDEEVTDAVCESVLADAAATEPAATATKPAATVTEPAAAAESSAEKAGE